MRLQARWACSTGNARLRSSVPWDGWQGMGVGVEKQEAVGLDFLPWGALRRLSQGLATLLGVGWALGLFFFFLCMGTASGDFSGRPASMSRNNSSRNHPLGHSGRRLGLWLKAPLASGASRNLWAGDMESTEVEAVDRVHVPYGLSHLLSHC